MLIWFGSSSLNYWLNSEFSTDSESIDLIVGKTYDLWAIPNSKAIYDRDSSHLDFGNKKSKMLTFDVQQIS
jgi:hypothetical protein